MTSTSRLKNLAGELRLFGVLLLLMLILSLISDRFLTVDNLTNVLWSVCLIGIMTTGAMYAPVTGGIDLSVGSMAALAGILANVFMNTFGMHWILAMLLTLLIGAAATASVTKQPVTIKPDYIQIENSAAGSSAGWDFSVNQNGYYRVSLQVANVNADTRSNQAFLDGTPLEFTSGPSSTAVR